MKVLLIGATGQIGYTLVMALSKTVHQTSLLVRNKTRHRFPKNITVIEAKQFTPDVFSKAILQVDCVIYAVGLPEQFAFDDEIFRRVNYEVFKTFLDALRLSTLRRLIYISTYEVFQPVNHEIRESDQIADQLLQQTPYFKTMTQAYQLALQSAEKMDLDLTTIHPAAVYGGLNTGSGITNYIENLLNWRVWKIPVIIDGKFPIVHADSLARAILLALDRKDKHRAFIVSDQMTTLKEIAQTLRQHVRSYLPPAFPHWLVYSSTFGIEKFSRLLKMRPIMAKVQLDFITKGIALRSDRAQEELGWKPMSLNEGIKKYLEDRKKLLPGD